MFGLFCSYFPRKGTPVLEHSLIDVLLLIEDISESEGYIYIYTNILAGNISGNISMHKKKLIFSSI